MNQIELRVSHLLAALAFVGCGNSAPTDFHSTDPEGSGGGGGAQQGGSGGSSQSGGGGVLPGGTAGTLPGGSGGTAQAGTGAGGSTALGGSAGSVQGGEAGTGLGGTQASGGTIGGGGSTGARGGTGGSGVTPYPCGTLMCVQRIQMCVHTLPGDPGGPQQYQCIEYPNNCATVDCSCFCKGEQNSPCGPESACACSGDPGRVTVTCGES